MFVEPVDSEASSLNSSVKQVEADEVVEGSSNQVTKSEPVVEDENAGVERTETIAPSVQIEREVPIEAVIQPELSTTEVSVDEGAQPVTISENEAESETPVVDSPTVENIIAPEHDVVGNPEAPATEVELSVPEPPAEPAVPKFEEYLEKATEAKTKATNSFKLGDYDIAKINYMTALETLQYVQGDLDNKQKAVLFEQTVACNNNVALCCLNTDDLANAVAFGTNSLMLIRSLEKSMPDSIIWMCLQQNGITEDQMQRQWKRKALLYIGKAQLKRKNFQEAVVHLEEAHSLIAEDQSMAKLAAEHKTLLTDAKNRLSKEKQREKDTWSKAFKKGKTEVESIYHNPRDTPTSSAPDTPTRATEPVDPNNLKFDLSELGGKDSKKKKAKKEAESSTALTTWPAGGYYSTFFFLTLFAAIGGGSFWFLNNRRR